MKKRILLVAAVMLCVLAVAYGQGRLHRRAAEVSINENGAIVIKAQAGQAVAVTGNTAITGTLSASGTVTASAGLSVSGRNVAYATKTALTAGATVTVDSTLGNFFTLTPGEDETINATTVGVQGQVLLIKITTSGTTSRTLTFGTNFKTTGTLATGTTSAKVFQIAFLSDGTTYSELFRTAAM